MNITITIDDVDRTSTVLVDSLRISDEINERVNEARFRTVGGYRPSPGDELSITDGATTLFAGIVLKVKNATRGLKTEHQVTCKDWTHYLDRKLVTERYEDTTVEAIITDILSTYTTGFTANNVLASISVDSIAFNRMTVTEAIERLAELTGYSWYVDYAKDVHFFAKSTEAAPFSLTAEGDNHVWDSLEVEEDLSQLRNQIIVIGGEAKGNERTETYVADGDQLQLPLANKFATLPTVTVNGVAKTVGVDFLADEDDYDCFWSFQQKYIRFKESTQPVASDKVAATGIPLFPIIVNVGNSVSIDEYGTYEFKIRDDSIKSREQAIDRARVELKQDAETRVEGSFRTYESGLKSGQVISIDANGISGDFLIQKVALTMRTPSDGEWAVSIASTKTIGMLEFLRSLMRDDEITQDEAETLLNFFSFSEEVAGTDTLTTPFTKSSPPYLWGPDGGNVGTWNYSTWG